MNKSTQPTKENKYSREALQKKFEASEREVKKVVRMLHETEASLIKKLVFDNQGISSTF